MNSGRGNKEQWNECPIGGDAGTDGRGHYKLWGIVLFIREDVLTLRGIKNYSHENAG